MPMTPDTATSAGSQIICPPTTTRRHADIVHGSDAEADHRSAEGKVRAARTDRRVPKSAARDDDGNGQ